MAVAASAAADASVSSRTGAERAVDARLLLGPVIYMQHGSGHGKLSDKALAAALFPPVAVANAANTFPLLWGRQHDRVAGAAYRGAQSACVAGDGQPQKTR